MKDTVCVQLLLQSYSHVISAQISYFRGPRFKFFLKTSCMDWILVVFVAQNNDAFKQTMTGFFDILLSDTVQPV
jgi:hypothetical protein